MLTDNPPRPDGPCEVWPINPDCMPGWPATPEEWTPQHHTAVELATHTLWRLTAGRYGLCPELVRPCRRGCDPGRGSAEIPSVPSDPRARWLPAGCACGAYCHCGPLSQVALPGPVNLVLEVRVDGVVLPETAYRLLRTATGGRLVRADGGEWPKCQDLTRAHDQPGTWSVLYLRGNPVPLDAVSALSTLALEMYKRCAGVRGCRLPDRVQTITRDGVTFDIVDTSDWVEKGLTGLPEVDAWVRRVNPKLHRRPAVFSLDLPGGML